MNEVQCFFIEDTRLGIPVDFTNERLRGVAFPVATSFPSQSGLGHTWDTELVREVGRLTASEARALGYTNIYAPTLDVARDQRWGRVEDTYGEDPYLALKLGVELVKGLQENYTVEIVKFYTRDLVSSVTTYEKNLRGFARVNLRPGDTKTVTFTLMQGDLSLWDRNMKFVVEPGMFRVMVGASSEDIRLSGDFEIVANGRH